MHPFCIYRYTRIRLNVPDAWVRTNVQLNDCIYIERDLLNHGPVLYTRVWIG